jgi:hypothetical protein
LVENILYHAAEKQKRNLRIMYNIAITGLGPAGATLARLLDKKYKTIVIEAVQKLKF